MTRLFAGSTIMVVDHYGGRVSGGPTRGRGLLELREIGGATLADYSTRLSRIEKAT